MNERERIAARIGRDLTGLTPAEEKIVQAIIVYVGIKRDQGRGASYSYTQLRNHGLKGAAEAAVSRRQPTLGFVAFSKIGRADLAYEQTILDHPEEFSSRATWFARRALGLVNEADRPPLAPKS